MRKLRLIKPWHLRLIRQKTEDLHLNMPAQPITVPCNGPEGVYEEVCCSRTMAEDLRAPQKNNVNFYHINNAPHSDVILVPRTNKKLR